MYESKKVELEGESLFKENSAQESNEFEDEDIDEDEQAHLGLKQHTMFNNCEDENSLNSPNN